MSSRRLRMRIEVVFAVVFALLAIVTILDPQWMEQLFEFHPDHGSGEAEWGLTAMFGVASVLTWLMAGRDWILLAAESTT